MPGQPAPQNGDRTEFKSGNRVSDRRPPQTQCGLVEISTQAKIGIDKRDARCTYGPITVNEGFGMQYEQFRIRNFKGIKDTTVKLKTSGGAGVFALVGLNESGKTTILEAVHSFSPDNATSELLGGEGVPYKERVPRHLVSTFTGDVSVEATLRATPVDIAKIAERLLSEHGLIVEGDLPERFVFERHQRFAGGDFASAHFTLRTNLQVKRKKQTKFRTADSTERIAIRDLIFSFTPDIAYFPTFVFDFPSKIHLTRQSGPVDSFYRQVFQDILDYDNHGHTIETDIVRRVRRPSLIIPWTSFLDTWAKLDDQLKIQHVMDRAGAAVTRLVFGRWNKIFGENTKGKEIIISYGVLEGEVRDENKNISKTEEHDVYVKFQIRDGTRRFDVNDRSLGFRWFFAFMLFTQFRVAGSTKRPLLFLFDEPASNLHAAAQQKLIESFPEIARDEHTLAYTTHSHYMIEPKWLEQTFIVTNRADAPLSSVLDDASLDDESLDVKADLYKNFVNKNPSQTSYFQPILDRLQVVPSRFDFQKASIVLEGKSDYYILRYAVEMHAKKELPLIPGLGAGTFGALIALHVGWGLDFVFVLDGDPKGKSERERYIKDYLLRPEDISTLDEFVPAVKVIEDLLDEKARGKIAALLGLEKPPTKGQILRFFQERLASGSVESLGQVFNKRSKTLLEALAKSLAERTSG